MTSARMRLGFDPVWSPQPGQPQSNEYRAWRRRIELRRLLAEGRRALIELHLPEAFLNYWVACFFAPYKAEGLETILDPEPSGARAEIRVFPPPVEEWFDAGVDYASAPAKLVIEGPAALASSGLLRAAVRRALEAKRRWGFVAQHPLIRHRQMGGAHEDRAKAHATANDSRSRAIAQARTWRAAGDKPSKIAYRLTQRGYKVSEHTIRRWTSLVETRNVATPFGHNEAPTGES